MLGSATGNVSSGKSNRTRGRRILAVALSAAMALTVTSAPAFAADSDLTKDETVYVITEASGEPNEVVVSDHLINTMEADTISDESNLEDIQNVKGDETFSRGKKDQLIWKAGGNDIYYEGKTGEKPPVTIDITYRLDGEKIEGKDLKGKSGDLEIRMEFENDAKIKVNGKETTVPFVAMVGFLVRDEGLTDITIDNGKVIDDGDKKIVIGMAAPGLRDDLDLDNSEIGKKLDVDLGDSVTIKATANDYNVQDIMTVVTNTLFDHVDSEDIGDLGYDDQIDQLDDGAKALTDGAGELYEGLHKMNEQMPTLKKGVDQLDSGAVKLRGTLRGNMKKIAEATDQLHAGTGTILDGLKTMKTGLDKGDGTAKNPGAIPALGTIASGLAGGAGKAREGAGTLRTSAGQLQQAADGVAAVDQGLKDGLEQTKPNLDAVNASLESLNQADMAALEQAINASNMSPQAKGQVIQVMEGYKQTANGAAQIANGEYQGMAKAQGGTAQIVPGLSEAPAALSGAADQMDASADGLDQAAGGVTAVRDGLSTMSEGLGAYDRKAAKEGKGQTTLIGGMTVIDSGLGELNREVAGSVSKKGKLTKALNKLVRGTGKLKKGTGKLADGTEQLDDGSKQLNEGMTKLYDEGIKKIVDLYRDELKASAGRLGDMVDAGREYNTFTRLPKGMDGNVKFIYKTTVYH